MIDLRRFHDLLRERAWHIPCLAVGIAAVDFLRTFPVIAATPTVSFAGAAAEEIAHWLVRCGCLVVLLSLVDALRIPRWKAAVVRVAAVAFSAWANSDGLEVWIFGATQVERLELMSPRFAAYVAWLQLAAAALMTWYYAARQRALEVTALLTRAECEREEARQAMIESRLEVLRARIDPQRVLDTLANVQDLYRTDAAAADRALDDLIDHLGAAFQGRTVS